MKLVFLSAGAGGGGAEEVLFDLVTALGQEHPSWEISVICGEEGSLVSRLKERGVSVESILFPKSFQSLGEQANKTGIVGRLAGFLKLLGALFSLAQYSWQIRRRISQLNPDIVHSNGVKMHVVSAFSAPSSKLIWHVHDYLSHRRISSMLLPRLGGKANLLCNSADVMRDAQKLFQAEKVQLLENPIDTDRFQPAGPRADLDKLAGMEPAAPGILKIGLVATFAKWKGHQLFLQAIALLPLGLPARFYVVGGPIYSTQGSQWTMAEIQVEAAKLPYPVAFTGWVQDAPSAFRALDICVHASTRPEPFGLVIAQAMASGKAVIVSDEGGAAEVVKDYAPAVKFKPRDAASLATALQLLIQNAERRTASYQQGPEYVLARFGKKQFIERLNHYLQALIATP